MSDPTGNRAHPTDGLDQPEQLEARVQRYWLTGVKRRLGTDDGVSRPRSTEAESPQPIRAHLSAPHQFTP